MAIALTIFAGLSTGIDIAMAFFTKHTNYRFLSVATGFSAGVMLYVSFTEILGKAAGSLGEVFGVKTGNWVTALSFFAGIGVILLIDQFIPHAENPHETHSKAEVDELHSPQQRVLRRMV